MDRFTDFIWVSLVTLVLCVLASWLPARVASKTDPLRTIAFAQSWKDKGMIHCDEHRAPFVSIVVI